MGSTAKRMFEDEKAAVIQQIETECNKYAGESLPIPSRGNKARYNRSLGSPVHVYCIYIYDRLMVSFFPGMRIRFWQKTGSEAMYLKRREIFKSL